MASPLRIEYPGALYHVASRGNGKQKIFRSDSDRKVFLEIMDDAPAFLSTDCALVQFGTGQLTRAELYVNIGLHSE